MMQLISKQCFVMCFSLLLFFFWLKKVEWTCTGTGCSKLTMTLVKKLISIVIITNTLIYFVKINAVQKLFTNTLVYNCIFIQQTLSQLDWDVKPQQKKNIQQTISVYLV